MGRSGRALGASTNDRGTGLVEFAFVGVLFFTIIFAIVSFGVLLAFKQNMTQAASESARASIATVDNPTTTTKDERKEVAISSLEASLSEFGRECFTNVKCLVVIHECSAEANFAAAHTQPRHLLVQSNPAQEPKDPCLTTRVDYENRGDDRILPPFPIIASFEPDGFSSQTTVHLVPVPGLTPTTTSPPTIAPTTTTTTTTTTTIPLITTLPSITTTTLISGVPIN